MYTKGSRKDIVSSYDICKSDITNNIYKILYESFLSLPLFNNCNYYYDYDFQELKFKTEEQFFNYLPEYKTIFKKQFMYNNNIMQLHSTLYQYLVYRYT